MEDFTTELIALLVPLVAHTIIYLLDVLRKRNVSAVEVEIRKERLQSEAHDTVLGVAKMIALRIQKEYGEHSSGSARSTAAKEYFAQHPEVRARVEMLGLDSDRMDEYLYKGYELAKMSMPHLFEIETTPEQIEADAQHVASFEEVEVG